MPVNTLAGADIEGPIAHRSQPLAAQGPTQGGQCEVSLPLLPKHPDWSGSRCGLMLEWRSMERKIGPRKMPPISSHSRRARSGQVSGLEPNGKPTLRPTPSWSVLERRSWMTRPSAVNLTPFSVSRLAEPRQVDNAVG